MLTIIQVGHVEASDRYIRNKVKAIEAEGLRAKVINLPEESTTQQIIKAVRDAHYQQGNTAIMVQLPLPEHVDKDAVMASIPTRKDIDGLNPNSSYKPLTPCAIMRWFDENGYDLEGKIAVVLGRSELVGKPLAQMLIDRGATVTVCNSHTPERYSEHVCRGADIIVSAVGKVGTVHSWFVNTNQTYIDVGINRDINGKLCGDIGRYAREEIVKLGGYCSPVPGGVGKWTVRELVLRLKGMEEEYD